MDLYRAGEKVSFARKGVEWQEGFCGFVEGVDAVVQKIDNALQRFMILGL